MELILREVKLALKLNLYYLAIMTSLSLPDICAALESPNGETARKKYIKWCNTYLDYKPLTSEDLYSLRCGVLHQGMFEHRNLNFSRILFTLPNSNNIVLDKVIANDALNLDAIMFCEDIMNAVTSWYEVKKDDPNVAQNFPRLIQYRSHGLPPYIVGVPLIG